MDFPVSAFAMYNKNKKSKGKDEKKKEKTKPRISERPANVSDNSMIELAHKIKCEQKKNKGSKNIKRKTHKKKKSKEINTSNINKTDGKKRRKISENDDVPMLVPGPLPRFIINDEENDGSFEFSPVLTDSAKEGLKVFKWMIAPYNPDEFFTRVWEKKPLHISRNQPTYYKELISTPMIDNMLRAENIEYTKNIDITSYVNEKRETHNPEGRAHPHLVWDFYLNGCSIRLLNPQTYIPKLHLLNATLQEYFNSFVGANAYLTPPDSQGFAPHYDDIEAFILQTEGKKHWKIYKPRSENEFLPRESSINFDQNEIGSPILEVTLKAGDMLYFPRGYIHQGVTIEGEHSLHVTISMYQKHSWADLFEKMVPIALQMAIKENVDFRRGLPFDMYDNFGLVNSDVNTPRREKLEMITQSLFDKIKHYLQIDGAVDQLSKNYQHDALPPVLSDVEKAVTVYGDSDVMIDNGVVVNRVEIALDTRVRLLRKNILRLVAEEECIRVYYHVENSLEYHGNELTYLEINEELIPIIETLITSYPNYVSVESLEGPDETEKLQITDALWSRGLIMCEYPLDSVDD